MGGCADKWGASHGEDCVFTWREVGAIMGFWAGEGQDVT